jgi:hypothetical protein
MFGQIGLHVIQFPSGVYGFVGMIPIQLCRELPADRSAVMGQRAVRNAAGALVEYRTMLFETGVAAVEFAVNAGFQPRNAEEFA